MLFVLCTYSFIIKTKFKIIFLKIIILVSIFSKNIIMQYPLCCHDMAKRFEDNQFFYSQCRYETCFAAGIQCKYFKLIKLSKKVVSETSNILC